MLKNILTKINNFIQWTKKWHFCHVFLLISSFIMFMFTIFSLMAIDWIGELKFTYFFLPEFIYIFAIVIALIIQILFSLINFCIHKNIQIKNRFLLNNKTYNGIYYLMFLYTIVSFVIHLSLLFTDYV